jgi:D-arabinose 1-dehydrogenase-like Zn-dependent alcohol dehydrogenase
MVEMGRAFGAEVVCVERDPAKAAQLRELDLGTVVESVAGFLAGDLVEAAGGTFDAVFDLVSSSETFALGYGSLSAGGTLVMIGTGGQPGEVIPSDTIAREKTVTGSRNATRSELAEALDLVASGAVRTHVGRRLQLESVNEAFDAVAANDVFGRMVIDVAPGADGGAL